MRIININSFSEHFGSEGIIRNIELLPDSMGSVIVYEVINNGENFKQGDILKKTIDQLQLLETEQGLPKKYLQV
jgi:hypothetical protein